MNQHALENGRLLMNVAATQRSILGNELPQLFAVTLVISAGARIDASDFVARVKASHTEYKTAKQELLGQLDETVDNGPDILLKYIAIQHEFIVDLLVGIMIQLEKAGANNSYNEVSKTADTYIAWYKTNTEDFITNEGTNR